VDRRTLRGRDALGGGEILDRLRHAVQRAHVLAAPELIVAQRSLGEQLLALAHGDDGVDRRIEAIDVVEIGVHDLDAGELLRPQRLAQRQRIHHHDVGYGGFGLACGLLRGHGRILL
jgi:hypothetical protein